MKEEGEKGDAVLNRVGPVQCSQKLARTTGYLPDLTTDKFSPSLLFVFK